mgnify:CR=1 FL=1
MGSQDTPWSVAGQCLCAYIEMFEGIFRGPLVGCWLVPGRPWCEWLAVCRKRPRLALLDPGVLTLSRTSDWQALCMQQLAGGYRDTGG